MRYLSILFLLQFYSGLTQVSTNYYINWNVDHTERTIRPSIPISKAESDKINCYLVSFDGNRFSHVQYFYSGKPSIHSSYGAFELTRTYYKDRFEDKFRGPEGNYVSTKDGVFRIVYLLNEKGYWKEKQFYDKNNNPIDVKGSHSEVAFKSIVSRDNQNRKFTELRFNSKNDTVPDINGFKLVHFEYDSAGFISCRKQVNSNGILVNGPFGYAKVNFQCNSNGNFLDEEFLNENNKLVVHPRLCFARVNFREFNQYGKFQRVYYIDAFGHPDADRAFATVEYNANSSRKKVTFYDRSGQKTEDNRGVAYAYFSYNEKGEFLGRVNYDIENQRID